MYRYRIYILEKYTLNIMEFQINEKFISKLGNVENLCEQDSNLEDLCIHMLLTCTGKKGNLDRDN